MTENRPLTADADDRDEVTERCEAEGHPRYQADARCYCGAISYAEMDRRIRAAS